jgi:hypothetical protein
MLPLKEARLTPSAQTNHAQIVPSSLKRTEGLGHIAGAVILRATTILNMIDAGLVSATGHTKNAGTKWRNIAKYFRTTAMVVGKLFA